MGASLNRFSWLLLTAAYTVPSAVFLYRKHQFLLRFADGAIPECGMDIKALSFDSIKIAFVVALSAVVTNQLNTYMNPAHQTKIAWRRLKIGLFWFSLIGAPATQILTWLFTPY